jgi:hypothetical protein
MHAHGLPPPPAHRKLTVHGTKLQILSNHFALIHDADIVQLARWSPELPVASPDREPSSNFHGCEDAPRKKGFFRNFEKWNSFDHCSSRFLFLFPGREKLWPPIATAKTKFAMPCHTASRSWLIVLIMGTTILQQASGFSSGLYLQRHSTLNSRACNSQVCC